MLFFLKIKEKKFPMEKINAIFLCSVAKAIDIETLQTDFHLTPA